VSKSASCDEDVDLIERILEAVRQIPEGKVSTYGDIARALGDVRAARVIGATMGSYSSPVKVPCHRVVYADGRVGWWGGSGRGSDRKTDMLEGEGVKVIDGVVSDLDSVLFRDFTVEPILKILSDRQSEWRKEVVERDDFDELRSVAGLDVAYDGDVGYAAVVIVDAETEKVLETRTSVCRSRFPYIPSYLGFRETPMFRPLADERRGVIYLVDGHGVLHPRGFGVACQIGIRLGIPTIGAAKSLLEGKVKPSDGPRDEVEIDGKLRGYAIGKIGRRSTYVSVGHRVSLATATAICERLMHRSVPEPLRLAHILANEEKRKANRSEAGR
jgi:deoxyribonuclease V